MCTPARDLGRELSIRAATLLFLLLPAQALAENTPQIEHLRQYGTAQDDSALDVSPIPANFAGGPTYSYTVGTTAGTLPGQTSAGGIDSFITKYDRDKNVVWSFQFGTSGDDYATAVVADQASEQVYVTGYTNGTFPGKTSAGGIDIFFLKIDADGSVLLTEQYGTDGTDQAFDIAYYQGQQYIVGRTSGSFGQPNSGGFDFIVLRIIDGVINFSDQRGTSGDDSAKALHFNNNDLYVAGNVETTLPDQTNHGGSDLFVSRYNTTSSTVQWTSQFGTSDNDTAVGVAFNNDVYAVGATNGAEVGFTNAGGTDAVVYKLNPETGFAEVSMQTGSAGNDIPDWIVTNSANSNIYIGGTTNGTFPGQTSAGGTDIFIVKFQNNALLQWVTQFGTSATDVIRGVGLTQAVEVDSGTSDLFLAGDTTGAFDGFTNAGGTDAIDLKISQDEDSDNIYNEVDVIPQGYSDDFSDGVTTGSIEDRGTQSLVLLDAIDTGEGLSIEADPSGVPDDSAQVSICQDAATADLDPGDVLDVTCGSAIMSVTSGEVDATFTSPDGFNATTTLPEGNGIRFAVDSNEFTTPATNNDTLQLSVGATDQALEPGVKLIIVGANADTMLRKGPPNKNEGANNVLVVRKQGDIRSLITFDSTGLPPLNLLRKATLVLSVDATNAPDNWGATGRMIDVHRMTGSWTEGNGKDLDLPEEESVRGTGAGATWNCASDSNIENHQSNCSSEWDGGETAIASKTANGYLMKNNFTGQATWDVTQDVMDGGLSYGWMVKKREESKSGNVRFYSREGAASSPNLMPQLLLEFNQ